MPDDSGQGMPVVSATEREGWVRTEASTETVFRLPAAEVVGHTLVYEDEALRTSVRAATDGSLDRMWRFFFATRLSFSPPLPPAVGPMAVFSTVRSKAESEFAEILRERGFRDVESGTRQRVRVNTGDRARLRAFSATLDTPLPDGTTRELPVDGWLAVWTTDGEFRLAGGAYPARPLEEFLDIDLPDVPSTPGEFQSDLLSLVRSVE
jgi:hypothetical protein